MKIKKILLSFFMCILLCACGNDKATGKDNADNASQTRFEKRIVFEPIEITVDNFYDYFEEKEVVYVLYDAFDEIETVEIQQYFALKDEYLIDQFTSEVAIEYKAHSSGYYLDFDYETFQYTYEEAIEDGERRETTKTDSFMLLSVNNRGAEEWFYGAKYYTWWNEGVVLDEETQRYRTNERWLIDEIIRVKGTIYIAEMEALESYYDVTQYSGTPRLESIFAYTTGDNGKTLKLEGGYEIEFHQGLRDNPSAYAIIVDNNTPENTGDDTVVCVFCE